MKGQGLVLIGILAGVPSVSAVAAGNDGVKNTTVNTFSLQLGATRLIYDPDASGETLTIFNHQDYPVLVQSEVLKEDRTGGAPFVVTPPLFRLDGQQSSRLRIIRTGGNFPTDRESLQWLCVKSVPPRAEDKWAEEQDEKGSGKISVRVQVSLNSCIKLLVRPSAVKGHPDDVAGKVTWTKAGNRLKGTNPTPFYINLSELSVGGKVVNEQHYYIAPFSSYEFALPSGVAGKVQWKVVTDYGGVSQPFEAALKG